MKNKNTRILLFEDNPGDIRLVREVLAEAGAARFDLVAKMDLASGLAALAAQPVDAILLDLTLPDTAGFETFTKVHEKAPQVPIIVLTGADDDLQAAKALREGAQDYLVKGPGNNELLLRSIRYAIERKQSAEALRENEARYRNIFEGVEDAIFVETPSGHILDVNQRACDMYGFTRKQFLTKSVADLVPSKEYSVLFSPDNPAAVPGHPVETINVRSNGEQFPIELSLRKQESKGEPVLFVVVRDITERKRSQETIELLRHSIDIHYDGAYWTDSNNKFIYINDAGCKALGYEREELIGKNFSDINPKATPAAVERMWKSIRSKGSFTTETVHRRKDGNEFPVEIATTYIQFGGREYTCGFARDITARKQAERAIHMMSDTQRQIAQLNDITEISKLVGKKIHELIGSGYVIISTLDEKIQAMKVVGLYGFGGLYENLVRQFKIDPSEFAYPIHDMTAEELGSFRSGKLEKFAGGVYELLTRKVPKKICALVEKQMKFSGIHTMGFVNQDIHYGALTILEKGDIGPYKDMIETIMNQATISIKRIRAEQALRASELRYRAVIRLSSDFSYSCVHTSEDRYEVDWITDAFFHITGYSETELQGQRCWMFVVHPQDIQAATEPMSRLQPGESDSREFRIFTKTGEVRWFVNTMECQSDPATSDGLRLFGAVQDITGRKKAEEAKQESDLLLRALFELSPDSIMLMDPHTPDDSWPIIDCNLAACRINGYERDELIGNSIDMVNAFPANPADRAAYRKRMRDQGSLHLEATHRRKDGTVFPVEVSSRLIQVGQRELVIGIDRDITERKQVETALQASEERFREIFENISSGVVVYEAVDGGNDFKINHFNRAAEKIENIARDTVIGKTITEAFPGAKEFGLFGTLQRVLKNGQPEHLPITFYTDERMSGWRENYIARLPSGEILVVYEDVTERKQAEEALRASEELFRSFIEQSSEGVILLDEQGCIIEWNHAQVQITGITAEQAIGTPFWEIQYRMLPPDRRSERSSEFFKQAMLEAFRTGKFPTSDKSIETNIYTPQAETKFILQASFPIHSKKGYRIGSLVRDITERKRAELELQASHKAEQDFSERLSTLLEVTTELSKAGGLDESCRRAVELGHGRLGLDRLSIWFISDDHTTMQGTFGVDVAGRITDERQERFPIRPDLPVWSLVEGQVPLVHVPGESLYLDGLVIGQGDHIFAGLWDGNTVTGYISVDNLLSQRPFSNHDCEIIRLYASTVGRLISLKRAETTLRTSEENYRGAIAAAGLVPYGINYETQRFTFMGDNILQLTGYSAEEITPAILKNCLQESHVWGLEATGVTQEEVPRRFRSGEIKKWGNDLRITTRTGEERWLSDVSVPLQNKLGKVTSAIGIFQDLTERKQAEQALQKSEARFRSIFENTVIGFYQTTPAGQILLANPAILHMLGYGSFEDLSKRNLEDREYQLEYPRTEFRRRIETDGEIKDLETVWIKADNTTLYVRENARVVRDVSGKVLYYEGTVEDITGRKLAEEKLREASSYNRRLIEASIDPLVTIGPDGKITDVNEATEAVTGVARAQLIGDDFTNYFTEAAKARESYQKVLADGLVRDYPLTIRHASGKTIDVLYNATVYKNGAGEIQGVFAAARDITERKQSEAVLVKTERIYRQAITGAGGVPYQVDYANDRYVFLGEGFESLTGFLPSEIAGSAFFASRIRQTESYGEYKELPHEQRIQLSRQDGSLQEWREDYQFERKDGTLVWLSDHSVPVLDAAGNLIGSLGILMDITERKQVEEALRESEERFRFIFENANDAIFIENARDEFLSANQRASEMLGYSLEEFQKLHVADIQAPEVRQPGSVVKNEMLQHKGSIFEGLDLHSSGRRIPVEISVGQIEQASGDLYVSIVRDITERKQAEAALTHQSEELRQRNEELARLYRASSSLLSGASSNLQELAQTIIGIIQQEFGQANCSLFLVQRDSNELQRLAAAGPYTDQVKKKTLTLDGPGLVPQAIRIGQTVNVGNVHTVPDYLPNWESAMSEMAVPLKIGIDVIGIIDTQSALPNAFDKQDESLMTIFAERAALALEHSRMYEQTEARVQQLAALRTVDMAISSSFDIHLTLDILLDQVRAQLGVDAADILEYNQVTQTFSFSCGQGFRTHALQHTHLRLGEGYAGKAAMERRLFKIPDLRAEQSGFGRSPLLIGENFLSYAGVPLIAKGQIKGVLEVFNRETFELSSEQQSFLEILAGQAGIAMDNAELYEHQQRSIADLTIAYNDTLEGWASALELRDKETEGHTRRVTNLTIRLARALGVNENDQVQIYRGALLHDIGKIGVPDAIVLKPGPLTDEEWELMRQHPLYAYNMLSPIGYLREALNVPYCHHEKWDGTGYPRGLKAEEIPLAARIFSVVDVWDALTSDRPYRTAWTHEKARLYITEQSGAQFEPRIVETFFREVLTQ